MLLLLLLAALVACASSKPVNEDSGYFPTYELTDESVAYASPSRYKVQPTDYPPQYAPLPSKNKPEEDEPVYDLSNIPGEPGKDFPILAAVVRTSFTCADKNPGFYADVDTGCQMWHYCDTDYREERFICPNGTIYAQERRVCDWWFNVDCSSAEKYYSINEDLYIIPEPYYKEEKEGKFPPEVKPSYTQTNSKPKYQAAPQPQQPEPPKYIPVETRYPEGASSFEDPSYIEPASASFQQPQRARNYKK